MFSTKQDLKLGASTRWYLLPKAKPRLGSLLGPLEDPLPAAVHHNETTGAETAGFQAECCHEGRSRSIARMHDLTPTSLGVSSHRP